MAPIRDGGSNSVGIQNKTVTGVTQSVTKVICEIIKAIKAVRILIRLFT